MAVVEGDGAGVGDGVEAELLGVLGVSRPDVLSPGEGEHLYTQAHRDAGSKARELSFFVIMGNFKHRGPEKSLLTTPVPVTQLRGLPTHGKSCYSLTLTISHPHVILKQILDILPHQVS